MNQKGNFKFHGQPSCLGLSCNIGLMAMCIQWITKFAQTLNIKISY
jgi:hypothetical protein